LRPDRSVASDVRLVSADVGGGQQLEFVLAHAVGQAPLPVLFEPPLVLLAEGDLEGGDLEPREAAGGGVGLPHAVGDLGAPREDLAADRIEVEGTMDDARVPPRRVHGDVDLLLEDRDATLVLLGEPVGDRGPEDSAADDGHVPRLHPRPRRFPEFIMALYLPRLRSRIPREPRESTRNIDYGLGGAPSAAPRFVVGRESIGPLPRRRIHGWRRFGPSLRGSARGTPPRTPRRPGARLGRAIVRGSEPLASRGGRDDRGGLPVRPRDRLGPDLGVLPRGLPDPPHHGPAADVRDVPVPDRAPGVPDHGHRSDALHDVERIPLRAAVDERPRWGLLLRRASR